MTNFPMETSDCIWQHQKYVRTKTHRATLVSSYNFMNFVHMNKLLHCMVYLSIRNFWLGRCRFVIKRLKADFSEDKLYIFKSIKYIIKSYSSEFYKKGLVGKIFFFFFNSMNATLVMFNSLLPAPVEATATETDCCVNWGWTYMLSIENDYS